MYSFIGVQDCERHKPNSRRLLVNKQCTTCNLQIIPGEWYSYVFRNVRHRQTPKNNVGDATLNNVSGCTPEVETILKFIFGLDK